MSTVFFIICTLFQTLILCSFIDKMLTRKYNALITVLIWVIAVISDEVIVQLANSMNINALIYYLILIGLLLFLYKGSIKNKIIVMGFICAFSIIAEFVVYFVVSAFFEMTDDIYLIASASAKIVECVFLRIVLLIKKDKKNMELSFRIWSSVLIIPITTNIIFYLQYYINGGFDGTLAEIIFYSLFLLINYIGFSMFDDIQQVLMLRQENKLLENQKEYYLSQCEESQKHWENMREFRHNISNQYISELLLLKEGEYEKLAKRYEQMIDYVKQETMYSDSGNLYIDSLVNYKLSILKELNTKINCEVKFQYVLENGNDDVAVVVGNLIDNSIEAIRGINNKDREFNIKIIYDNPNFMMFIQNTYEGERKLDSDNNYITTKKDNKLHGIGLKSIKRIVEEYDGKVLFDVTEKYFEVRVHMILPSAYQDNKV